MGITTCFRAETDIITAFTHDCDSSFKITSIATKAIVFETAQFRVIIPVCLSALFCAITHLFTLVASDAYRTFKVAAITAEYILLINFKEIVSNAHLFFRSECGLDPAKALLLNIRNNLKSGCF